MKIFITGGRGFIGRNLCEQLGSRHTVMAPSSEELDLLDCVKVRDYLTEHKFDAVIHAATWNASRNSRKDLSKVLEHNLLMFFNIARNAPLFGKMINFGSGAEYSRPHWVPLMKEEYFDSSVPADGYGFSKYVMRKYLEGALSIVHLVLFGVYGKYEDWEIRFISNACCKALHDLPITMKQNVYFDYLFIDDLVKIIAWFLEHDPRHRVYNVCTGEAVDLETCARIVCQVSGKELPIRAVLTGLGREYSGDNSRLLGELGAFPFSPAEESIKCLFSWYESHRDSIDRNKLLVDK
ncbi:MAG: NAD(P)-dependent oxidoreductase [Candidatus Eremiobacteraeota bacterium]|nr:NAD(P)-dependent oxidoreductase [Candidatus Eremiobacteraeota bacterium]